jgi:hypothetical protein
MSSHTLPERDALVRELLFFFCPIKEEALPYCHYNPMMVGREMARQ